MTYKRTILALFLALVAISIGGGSGAQANMAEVNKGHKAYISASKGLIAIYKKSGNRAYFKKSKSKIEALKKKRSNAIAAIDKAFNTVDVNNPKAGKALEKMFTDRQAIRQQVAEARLEARSERAAAHNKDEGKKIEAMRKKKNKKKRK